MSTMKSVTVIPLPTLTTTISSIPIPTPKPDEVVICVRVAGSNVKDWSHITARNISCNSGDDVAGEVYSVGSDVSEFKVGDRVAAFHEMLKPHGAYAEYAVAKANTTFKLPETVSYEEAATVPLVLLTAAITMRRLGYPFPGEQQQDEEGGEKTLVVYGASSSLGAYIIKLAKLSDIYPIIAVAGGSSSYVSSLLDASKGDKLFDYRSSSLVSDVRSYLSENGYKATNGVDAISSNKTWVTASSLLESDGTAVLSVVSGANAYDDVEGGVEVRYTYVGTAHYGAYMPGMPKQPSDPSVVKGDVEFAGKVLRYVGKLMGEKKFEGHPYEVIPGGLGGVEEGLTRLKEGKAKGVKYVYRIGETECL